MSRTSGGNDNAALAAAGTLGSANFHDGGEKTTSEVPPAFQDHTVSAPTAPSGAGADGMGRRVPEQPSTALHDPNAHMQTLLTAPMLATYRARGDSLSGSYSRGAQVTWSHESNSVAPSIGPSLDDARGIPFPSPRAAAGAILPVERWRKPALAIFMGTRKGDPDAATLTGHFSPSSPGWPSFLRVCPLLEWTPSMVWRLLRCAERGGRGEGMGSLRGAPASSHGDAWSSHGGSTLGSVASNMRPGPIATLGWCSLYNVGFTSLGDRSKTKPNPALWRADGWRPAWELEDDSLERAGRVGGKPPSGQPASVVETDRSGARVNSIHVAGTATNEGSGSSVAQAQLQDTPRQPRQAHRSSEVPRDRLAEPPKLESKRAPTLVTCDVCGVAMLDFDLPNHNEGRRHRAAVAAAAGLPPPARRPATSAMARGAARAQPDWPSGFVARGRGDPLARLDELLATTHGMPVAHNGVAGGHGAAWGHRRPGAVPLAPPRGGGGGGGPVCQLCCTPGHVATQCGARTTYHFDPPVGDGGPGAVRGRPRGPSVEPGGMLLPHTMLRNPPGPLGPQGRPPRPGSYLPTGHVPAAAAATATDELGARIAAIHLPSGGSRDLPPAGAISPPTSPPGAGGVGAPDGVPSPGGPNRDWTLPTSQAAHVATGHPAHPAAKVTAAAAAALGGRFPPSDLSIGSVLTAVVRDTKACGVFVDCGCIVNGLVPASRLGPNRQPPTWGFAPGQLLSVRVFQVDTRPAPGWALGRFACDIAQDFGVLATGEPRGGAQIGPG